MIDPEIYARATGSDRAVRLALAEDEDTPPVILYLLEHTDDDIEVTSAASYNYSTPSSAEMSLWAKNDDAFNADGIHSVTGTRFNEAGYDCEGFDETGRDGNLRNREGVFIGTSPY